MLNILLLLFWFASATLSGLASADLLLRDSQKEWVNNRAADFWNWLDDQRELKYLRYLRGFRWLRFVAMLYAFVALLIAVGIGILYSRERLARRRFKPVYREILSTLFWADILLAS